MAKHLKILIPHGIQYNYLNLIPLINKFEGNSKFSEICLYHAYEPPKIRGAAMPNTLKELMDDDEKTINNFLNNQAEIMSKLLDSKTKIKTVIRKNRPLQGIKVMIKKYKPDIIMMSTQDRMGVSKFINSSVALKLMNQVDIPILILPQSYKFKKDIRLNFLIKDLDNYELAKELSKGFIDIFDDIQFIHRLDGKKDLKKHKNVIVEKSIANYIKKSKNDEVFMLIRKKKGKLQNALTKGFVDRLIGLNQAPVIIINK